MVRSARRWLTRWPRIKSAAISVSKPMFDFTCQMATLEPPPPHMQQLFAALRGNQEATNQFFSAITGSSPLPAFMNPENIGRIVSATLA